MQVCREPLCFPHFSNILLCKFLLPQQSRIRFSSSQFIETAVSSGLPLPATEGRNQDYCGTYFVCFPFLKEYNSVSFGWSLVAEFGRRGPIRSLELGSVPRPPQPKGWKQLPYPCFFLLLRGCSCLGNPMVRGACWATVYGAIKSRTQLRMHTCGCFWWAGKSPNWSIKDWSGGSIFNFYILIQLSRVSSNSQQD